MLEFWPRREHTLIGRDVAADGAADVTRGSRRRSSGVCDERNSQMQRDGQGRSREEVGKEVAQYTADCVATCNMTPDADGRTKYRECSLPLGLANEETTSIAGYGDLTIAFHADNRWLHVKLHNVAHAPRLIYKLYRFHL